MDSQIGTVSQIEQECIADLEKNKEFQRKCWEALKDLRVEEKHLQVLVQLADETKNIHSHIVNNNGRIAHHQARKGGGEGDG